MAFLLQFNCFVKKLSLLVILFIALLANPAVNAMDSCGTILSRVRQASVSIAHFIRGHKNTNAAAAAAPQATIAADQNLTLERLRLLSNEESLTALFTSETDKYYFEMFSERWLREQTYKSLDSYTKELIRRYSLGLDNHSRILIDQLGYKVIDSPDGPSLWPPRFTKFLALYYKAILNHVEAGSVKLHDLILPAIPILHPSALKDEIRLIRVGIDPFPQEKSWILRRGSQQSFKKWSHAMAIGRMNLPLSSGILLHDLSHVTDYLEDIGKMAGIRRTYQNSVNGALALNIPGLLPIPGMQLIQIPRHAAYMRLDITEEFLSLPDISHEEKIRRAVPFLFESASVSVETQLENLTNWYRTNPSQFMDYSTQFFNEAEKLFLRTGGGIRDPYNLQRYGVDSDGGLMGNQHLKLLARDLAAKGNYRYLFYDSGEFYEPTEAGSKESFHAVFARASVIFDTLADPTSLDQLARKNKLTSEQVKENLLGALILIMSRAHVAMYQALKLGITAGVVANDISDPNYSRQSLTYQYFSSFAVPNSITYKAFVQAVQ